MTTLAADKPRSKELGDVNTFGMVAADILYEGSAVGIEAATGLARPLVAGDRFVGFCQEQKDNSLGAAGALVDVREAGKVELAVSGAVITDIGQPVYATDDDTFVFLPVAASYIGKVHRFVSAGIVVVEYNAPEADDPYGAFVHQLKSSAYTIDATDTSKWTWVDTDAVVITLPAVEGIASFRVGNIAAFGTALISVAPNASDMIEGPGITAADNKAILNTKATAQRGDYLEIGNGDANGWSITRKRGTWVRAA